MAQCDQCIEKKTTTLTHTRCGVCGMWRPMTDKELAKVAARGR